MVLAIGHESFVNNGPWDEAAVAAAVASAPPSFGSSLPRSVVAQLGQSPVFFRPPRPAMYKLAATGPEGGLQLVICVCLFGF